MKKKTFLVTGGTGFIGSHIVTYMVTKYPQYYIVNLDKLDTCSSIHNVECRGYTNYKFIKGDITSPDLLNYILKEEKIEKREQREKLRWISEALSLPS